MPDGPHPTAPKYDDDFYAWTQYQASVLRALPAGDNRFDREHVAEEIEDLGKSERDAVSRQVRRIVEHFLKLTHSPAGNPRYGGKGSIIEARAELDDKLSPSLRHGLADVLPKLCATARKRIAADLQEHGKHGAVAALPLDCPYTLDQILADDWYPDPPEEEPK